MAIPVWGSSPGKHSKLKPLKEAFPYIAVFSVGVIGYIVLVLASASGAVERKVFNPERHQTVFPPRDCEGCPEAPASFETDSDLDESEWTCYWPQWPTSKPKKGHTLTFVVSHFVSAEKHRSLDHLETYTMPDSVADVRTIIGVIDKEKGTICVGDREEECAPRVMLSDERARFLEEMYLNSDVEAQRRKPWFWVAAMQQNLDFLGIYQLYEKRCLGQDDPILFSYLDNDMAACPGFGFHLQSIAHYATHSLVARSGQPFGLRISPGSSGFLIRPKFVPSYIDALKWVIDGDGPQWKAAADYTMDGWARGQVVAPNREAAPGVGMFQYYLTILNHLGNSESYFWPSEHASTRKVSECGAELWWRNNKERTDECFGQAWRPCTTEKWGEYVVGGISFVHDKVPDWYVDEIVEIRDEKRARAAHMGRFSTLIVTILSGLGGFTLVFGPGAVKKALMMVFSRRTGMGHLKT